MAGNNGADTKQDSDLDDAGSPVAPRLIEEEDEDASDSGRPKSGGQTAPQLLFNQLAHFSSWFSDACVWDKCVSRRLVKIDLIMYGFH